MTIKRRELLKYAAIAGGLLVLPAGFQRIAHAKDPESPAGNPFTLPFRVPPVLQPVRSDNTSGSNGLQDFEGTDYYEIAITKAQAQIIPGKSTEIWGYGGIFPGPTIKQKRDRQSVVRYINKLDVPMVIHLHGMAALPEYDGWAHDAVEPGYYKDFIYPNNRPATIWYHDHALHKTAPNVNMGLAGMYIVYDEYEQNLNLPSGEYDVPLVIHDKIFDRKGQIVYDDQGQKSLFGDVITVNGVAWPRMEVARRKYRFRVLNASVSRSYRLKLSSGDEFIMIGTDAGLRSAPVAVDSFRISMAERYEFILDFSKYPIGTKIVLENESPDNNEDYEKTDRIMRFDVVRDAEDTSEIPSTLRYVTPVSQLIPQAVRTREFRYERTGGQWVVNGNTWNRYESDANPQVGDVEIWTLYTNSGGWFHPIHVHLIDCQIIDRNEQPPFVYEEGWKDVIYVGGNESVRVVGKFGPHTGRYMTHCHNLVHEDHDMMRAIQIGNNSTDPALVAPPKPLPAPPL
ncbi:MAG: multicopper oxidase family protein [Coleofasciculus sp. G1-WW12-02]|uniref:multicopper oxidase family protein n=1 Tax=Coleofasciculus sp. G1-WW12-02 TaxID=3068483 RepID=UPI0032FCB77C